MKTADEERHSYLKARREKGGQSGNFKTSNLRDTIETRYSQQNFPNQIHSKNRNYTVGCDKRGSSYVAGSITNKYALFGVTSTPTLSGRHNVTDFPIKV
jgi:hypothetical protein